MQTSPSLPCGWTVPLVSRIQTSGEVAIPTKPAYKQSEYEFYLSDLKPSLVIVEQDSDNPVRRAAAALDIPVAEAQVTEDMVAGAFFLFHKEADIAPAGIGQEALVLHTSGTTSRPKVVPLLQKNILASAQRSGREYEITA